MQDITFFEAAKLAMRQFESQRGVFFTCCDTEGKPNTMTISWGSMGVYWGKPVFVAPIRRSRYTWPMVEQLREFTISTPLDDTMNEALAFCGSRSGRDIDKFAHLGLKTLAGKTVAPPVLTDCALHMECRVVYAQTLEKGLLLPDLHRVYSDNDMHTLYYGAVTACYRTDL